MASYKQHFKRSLDALGDTLHFAAHSHHLWPDVSLDGQWLAWHDAATRGDRKWGFVIDELIPRAQRHVAAMIGWPDPAQITFAPSTHDFVARLLSCLPTNRVVRIATTDGEFHSFARQAKRLAEEPGFELAVVPRDPIDTFADRFIARLRGGRFDMVYVSQVFYETAQVNGRLGDLADAAGDTLFVIDGYHGFAAIPTDLSAIAGRVFYTAGGYKYAMSGEGCCFLATPPGCALRPRDTGWFASFDTLESGDDDGPTRYRDDGWRFAGATFDPVGLYRFVAVWDHWASVGVDAAAIHGHVDSLQRRVIAGLDTIDHPSINRRTLAPVGGAGRGHFLAFDTGSPDAAASLVAALDAVGVRIDRRGPFVRIGFGLYHDEPDADALLARIARTVSEVTT